MLQNAFPESFPDKFKKDSKGNPLPRSPEEKKFDIPEEMTYEFMIHSLAKCYNQCKKHIEESYTETDFWEMLCFENLEGAKMKSKMNN